MKSKIHRFTPSELRGIALVVLANVALVYYFSWWFTTDNTSAWMLFTLVLAFIYGTIQLDGNWLLYLATHYRSSSYPPLTEQAFTVDVFITVCNESHALAERTLLAALAMQEEKKVWLLDDGNDPALTCMANRLGVGYLTRSDRRDAKAGNINAALAHTNGDIIVIFDIDHAPEPDFLTKSLGCFADPGIGFVQVMVSFSNQKESWISSAAAGTSLDFYNPTSIGADGLHSATLIGSNALIRRKALESIQGYQPGLAEDLATSIALHAAGWRSMYIAEPLAPGIAPPDLNAWFTQQLKWSRGVFELLLTAFPRYFRQLNAGHRVMYAVRMTYYWIGLFVGIHLLVTIAVLWRGSVNALIGFQEYLKHLFPLVGIALLIRQLALRRWVHPRFEKNIMQWKPTLLVFGTWPIYVVSWIMAVCRVPLRFQPTPKAATGSLHLTWLLPQMITIILLVAGVVYAFSVTEKYYSLVFAFSLSQAAAQMILIIDWIHSLGRLRHKTNSSSIWSHASSESPSNVPYPGEIVLAENIQVTGGSDHTKEII